MDSPLKPSVEPQATALSGRLVLMPTAYLPKAKKRLSSTAILAMVLAVVAILVIIVVVLFLTRDTSTPSAPVVETPIEQVPVPTPNPVQPSTPTPEPTVPEPTPVSTITIPSVISGSIPSAVDTDQDGLSDIEEQIFATSPSVPDTDQDGFLDGVELRNQYDPATPRALIEVSPQIKIVRNETLGYQTIIPVAWVSTRVTSDGKEFMVNPDQGSESFRITVYDNVDRIGVTEWFQRQQPAANLTQFVNFQNEAGWTGIQTQDHTLVIASFDDGGPGSRAFIFVMHYDHGQEPNLRYAAVWDLMMNALSVATAPASQPTQP